MPEPRFITLVETLYLHDESLRRFGGLEGIGSLGLVESALASAKNVFYYGAGDLSEVAAAYAFHVAESQAFNDGNKRTGVAVSIMFLRINGLPFREDDGTLYEAMIAIAKKRITKTDLANVIRKFHQP
ncbi:MAG: type II toxin-antitoxin system death-on-curing family toxin [Verrucomicrobia bacterium]|nr:type II toxin-antitoxin system death-on-curing family toxin [Verrucomicrobiota bacterium]